MEGFYDKMDDEQVAILLPYVHNAWGNSASAVTEEQVARQRVEY